MAKMKGHSPDLTVLGIEPEKINWGTELTPALQKAFPNYMKAARNEIKSLLGQA